MKIRINKLISDAGLGSRREVDEFIRRGRVKINGKRAQLGDMVGTEDLVLFDDLDLPTKELVLEHIALEKVLRHEQAKQDKPRTRDKASERAESQRLQHASKSAALRKTSKNNPVNKYRAKVLAGEILESDTTLAQRPSKRSGTRGAVRKERTHKD